MIDDEMNEGFMETQSASQAASDSDKKAREYNKWTENEDAAFIESMLHLLETKEVECGNFKNGGFKKLEALMVKKIPGFSKNVGSRHRWFKNKHAAICEIKNGGCSGFGWDENKKTVVADDDVYSAWIKANSSFSGLKKPFLYFDQLSMIFGKDRAMGGEATDINMESPTTHGVESAAATNFNFADGIGVESVYDDETSQRVLEHIINEGVSHRTFLKVPESAPSKPTKSSGSNKRSRNSKDETSTSVVACEIAKLNPLMEKATMNIEKMANSFCLEDELTVRRGRLYEELSKVEGLTSEQCISAAMVLIKDDRIAQLYYQLPTEEEKFHFLLRIID
ncbi:unnamed protein product [Linum trigynum]|uniref:Myb/SANT-like domain-containing protein n=1 Tax=Linum trigynum TaxID=586398 RepID=A0AAV2CBR8_9ROSI